MNKTAKGFGCWNGLHSSQNLLTTLAASLQEALDAEVVGLCEDTQCAITGSLHDLAEVFDCSFKQIDASEMI